jgi:hypothetical protein
MLGGIKRMGDGRREMGEGKDFEYPLALFLFFRYLYR